MKKKIIFLAPRNEWWTYFYYKDIYSFLVLNYSNDYDIYFYNSLIDYIKLHFSKSDIIFSIIPFLFKPIWTKKYFFNLHWNYKIERKNKWLWVKLLYLAELNLWFSDKIILTSYYLADKLRFKKKYINKIIIIPNFLSNINVKNIQSLENNYNFMTITSFKFYDKWKGIINLWNVIKRLWEKLTDKVINFTIIWNENNDNFTKIINEFNKISFPDNTNIIWKWWLNKNEINKEFLLNNTFLYWTELDNFPWVILEALNNNLKVYVNDFPSFRYFLDYWIMCDSEEAMVKNILGNRNQNIDFIKKYQLKEVIKDIIKLIW